MVYDRKKQQKIMEMFDRGWQNAVDKPNFYYKKKGTFGPFYTYEEVEKMIK